MPWLRFNLYYDRNIPNDPAATYVDEGYVCCAGYDDLVKHAEKVFKKHYGDRYVYYDVKQYLDNEKRLKPIHRGDKFILNSSNGVCVDVRAVNMNREGEPRRRRFTGGRFADIQKILDS